jgi:hypothetical protein
MNFRRFGAMLAVAAGAVAFSSGSAAAEAVQPTAAYAGSIVAGPGATVVMITYTCSSTDSPINHLFVAVKQGPLVDTGEHSSSPFADTFYSTNWKSDSGPNALNCDGVEHTQAIILKPQPGFEASVPRLHSGLALVQICVFDNVSEFGEEGPVDGGFAFDYTMEQVHAGNGLG